MTMKTDLIKALREAPLTPVGALQRCRCFSLSQRVGELRRDGYQIVDKWVRLNDGKRVKSYRIVGGPKA